MPWSAKVAGRQAAVVWQLAQVLGKFPATWFGFFVAWKLGRWQETQSTGVPENLLPTWHRAQSTRW